jgi:hypothetical protein
VNSFLNERTRVVRVNNKLSTSTQVTSGVIQGSCLGPTLFTVFIDSLLQSFDIPANAYADDVKLIAILSHYSHQQIQANVQRVHDWSLAMSMPLSIEKSVVLHCGADNPLRQYQCGTDILPDATNITDLGVIRSRDSSYREHVASVAQKGRRLVGQCFRALQSRDPTFMTQVYNTYILPVLLYASPVWTPHLRQDIDELEAVQRRFTRRLEHQKGLPYGLRLRNLEMLSLEAKRVEIDAITVYKLHHNMVGLRLDEAGLSININNTRGGGTRLMQQHVSTVKAASYFKHRASSLWNSIPNNVILSPSITIFKRQLRLWLRDINTKMF